jgi:peptide/nickel transport system ATP-binding protein
MALLEVEGLCVEIVTEDGVVEAVNGLSYTLDAGKALGIVGESGSGKSVSAMTLIGLTRFAGKVRISGQVRFEGRDLVSLPERQMRELRGGQIGMIFQDPLSSLHPFYRVGDQLAEAVRAHQGVSARGAREKVLRMLRLVGIPEPTRRVDAYPHQFSGGMRQRVMIAMAICNEPRLLIADEPTTALDVTMQAQILELIRELQQELGMAVILITHDLGVVAEVTDRVVVMYAGHAVEAADTLHLFERPEHPYTWGLLRSIPRLDSRRDEEFIPIPGRPPSLIRKPAGCAFHPRCVFRVEDCDTVEPPLTGIEGDPDHQVACLLAAKRRRDLWRGLWRELHHAGDADAAGPPGGGRDAG